VVVPVGISAGGYRYEFDGEHDCYTRHGQHIHFAWTADSGSLAGATRVLSHELVESITDPEGNAIRGVSEPGHHTPTPASHPTWPARCHPGFAQHPASCVINPRFYCRTC
jgi:hypothetical protein